MKECKIVKDLLPLYIEELCSEDSREYVEKHLEGCKECKESLQYLKYSEVCVEAVEKKEVNAFKKLEKYVADKDKKSNLLFLAVMGLLILLPLFIIHKLSVNIIGIYMCLQMWAVLFYFRNVPVSEEAAGKSIWRLGVQVVLLAGSSVIIYYALYVAKEGKLLFGVPSAMMGPLVTNILEGIIILSLVNLMTYLYQVSQKKLRYSMWSNLSLLTIGLSLSYMTLLFQMSTFENIWKRIIGISAVMCIAFAVMMAVLSWKYKSTDTKQTECGNVVKSE